MSGDRLLQRGGEAVIALAEGAELFCASGVLWVTPLQLSQASRALAAGQGWRASESMLVKLTAAQQARYTLACAPPKAGYAWTARSFIENCWSWAMPLSSARRHQA